MWVANTTGKICRFSALVNDVATPMYERRYFLIQYFLEDDTLAVHEVNSPEKRSGFSGREPQLWFRRGRCRRHVEKVEDRRVHAGLLQPLEDEDCIEVKELQVGQSIIINAQRFFIYDACPFTRKFFETRLGVTLPDLDIDNLLHKIPTRFSQDSCLDAKTTGGEKFTETSSSAGKQNGKNSSGAAPRNQELLKTDADALEEAEEVVTGATSVPNQFLLGSNSNSKPSQITKNNMIADKTPSALAALLHRLIGKLRKAKSTTRETFRYFDREKDHVLCEKDFEHLLAHYGYFLSDEDVRFMYRYFLSFGEQEGTNLTDDRKGKITFPAFVKAVSETNEGYTGQTIYAGVPEGQ
eukprot:g1579.t1